MKKYVYVLGYRLCFPARVLFYIVCNHCLHKVCLSSPWFHHHEPTEHREPSGTNQQRPGVPAAGSFPALQEWQLWVSFNRRCLLTLCCHHTITNAVQNVKNPVSENTMHCFLATGSVSAQLPQTTAVSQRLMYTLCISLKAPNQQLYRCWWHSLLHTHIHIKWKRSKWYLWKCRTNTSSAFSGTSLFPFAWTHFGVLEWHWARKPLQRRLSHSWPYMGLPDCNSISLVWLQLILCCIGAKAAKKTYGLESDYL